MIVEANAKINLCLNVIGRRANGYHDLDMIMIPLKLADQVEITLAQEDRLSSDDLNMPLDNTNTILKAIQKMRSVYGFTQRFHVHVQKRIPMEAGLAGGSSDAAAVIRGINKLLELNLPLQELLPIGKAVGADVPFCIMNCPARVQGIGERVEPILTNLDFSVLLVKPSVGISTKEAYQTLDFTRCAHPACDRTAAALKESNFSALCDSIGNTLESSAFTLAPKVCELKQRILQAGFEGVLMSGSGSTVFAITRNEKLLKEQAALLKQDYPFVEITEMKKTDCEILL